jgi:hypothetical protein
VGEEGEQFFLAPSRPGGHRPPAGEHVAEVDQGSTIGITFSIRHLQKPIGTVPMGLMV